MNDLVVGENGSLYFISSGALIAIHETPLPEEPELLGEFAEADATYAHVYFADLNDDGYDELTVRNDNTKTLHVFNGATGTQLWDPKTYDNAWPAGWSAFGETAIADFDGDGLGDIVTGAVDTGDAAHIYVYKGLTGSILADITGDYIPWDELILYDVIGGPFYTPDGRMDITGSSGEHLLVWDGNTFNKTIDLYMDPDASSLLYWYESNADNHPDPLVENYNSKYGILDGSLITATTAYRWWITNGMLSHKGNIGGYLNDDDVPDCYNYWSHWNLDLADGESGTLFTTYGFSDFTVGDYAWQFQAVADFDGDGHDEMVCTAYNDSLDPVYNFIFEVDLDKSSELPIWKTARNTYDEKYVAGHGYNPVICDLDGDGHPDILTVQVLKWGTPDEFARDLVVYDGRFGSEIFRWRCPEGVQKAWMSAGDMNGDGNLDFVLAESNKLKVYTLNTPIPEYAEQRPWLHPKKNLRNNMCSGDED